MTRALRFRSLAVILLVGLPRGVRAGGADASAALEQAMAEGESRLQTGDLAAAQASYRKAVLQGWLISAQLAAADGRRDAAREDLGRAAPMATDRPAKRALATAYLEHGDAGRTAEILGELAASDPEDIDVRRHLARALGGAGRTERAAATLAELEATGAGDPELMFALASDYLWLKRPADAERLFARLEALRPLPQTHVIAGYAYRDAGDYGRARVELERALALEPKVRHAHYTLGSVLLADAALGPDRRARAIVEFEEELRLSPDDPQTCDALGLEHLEAGRPQEALPLFEKAVAGEPRAVWVGHVGRAALALDRPAEAAAALRRAVALAHEQGASDADLEKIQYQLGLAARKAGALDEANAAFAEARRLASRWTAAQTRSEAGVSIAPETSPLAGLTIDERKRLAERAREALAQAYFNLAVIEAQGERFDAAADLFGHAAEVDPGYPNLQSSLGIARFKAGRFAEAVDPLERAVAATPGDPLLRRALALAAFDSGDFAKAAALLKDDPELGSDAGLAFSYGVALARTHRTAEARAVFERLRAARGSSPELEAAMKHLEDRP